MTSHRTFLVCLALVIAFSGYAVNSTQTKAESPNVVVSFQRFVTKHASDGDYECAEFVVSNCTAKAVWFKGHDLDWPYHYVQYLKNGQWEYTIGSCALGVDRYKLDAYGTIKFTEGVWLDPQKTRVMRVGISCSPQKDYNKEVEKIYWSEKVEVKK